MHQLMALDCNGKPEQSVLEPADLLASIGQSYVELYQHNGYVIPWIGYLYLVDGQCVGTCGFKSPPTDWRVEIAYFTFPGYEDRGYATAMAQQLIDIARDRDPRIQIAAQTLPGINASTAILRKLGFVQVAEVQDPDAGTVWEWCLPG